MRGLRLASFVLMAALLSGCTFLFPQEEELLAPPLVEPAEVVYRTMEAKAGDIEQKLDVYANFSPSKTASVAFEGQGGRIADIRVKLGQQVKEGDLLIELNSESLKRQIRQQGIEVEKARLSLENAQRVQVSDASFDMTRIERAELNVEIEEEKYRNLEVDYDRLYRDTLDAKKREDMVRQLDTQRFAIQKAKLELESVQAEYEQWKKDQDPQKDSQDQAARVRQAELELQKQQNYLSDLQGDLKNAQLFAPFDGVVSYVLPALEIGQNAEGYVTLFRISDPTQITLTYSGDSAHMFTVGMEVSVAIRTNTYKGTVAADPTTVPTVDGKLVSEVHFVVDNLTEGVTMGDSAKVTTVLKREEGVIVLPKNCINSFWGRKFVNLLVDGVKIERDVETGIETSTEVEVVKGLAAGELVIMP